MSDNSNSSSESGMHIAGGRKRNRDLSESSQPSKNGLLSTVSTLVSGWLSSWFSKSRDAKMPTASDSPIGTFNGKQRLYDNLTDSVGVSPYSTVASSNCESRSVVGTSPDIQMSGVHQPSGATHGLYACALGGDSYLDPNPHATLFELPPRKRVRIRDREPPVNPVVDQVIGTTTDPTVTSCVTVLPSSVHSSLPFPFHESTVEGKTSVQTHNKYMYDSPLSEVNATREWAGPGLRPMFASTPAAELFASTLLPLGVSRTTPSTTILYSPSVVIPAVAPVLGQTAGGKTTPNSQFYDSPTCFGGASVSRLRARRRVSSVRPYCTSLKPIPVCSGLAGSETAKRILQALEMASSPLSDAQKLTTACGFPLGQAGAACGAEGINFIPRALPVVFPGLSSVEGRTTEDTRAATMLRAVGTGCQDEASFASSTIVSTVTVLSSSVTSGTDDHHRHSSSASLKDHHVELTGVMLQKLPQLWVCGDCSCSNSDDEPRCLTCGVSRELGPPSGPEEPRTSPSILRQCSTCKGDILDSGWSSQLCDRCFLSRSTLSVSCDNTRSAVKSSCGYPPFNSRGYGFRSPITKLVTADGEEEDQGSLRCRPPFLFSSPRDLSCPPHATSSAVSIPKQSGLSSELRPCDLYSSSSSSILVLPSSQNHQGGLPDTKVSPSCSITDSQALRKGTGSYSSSALHPLPEKALPSWFYLSRDPSAMMDPRESSHFSVNGQSQVRPTRGEAATADGLGAKSSPLSTSSLAVNGSPPNSSAVLFRPTSSPIIAATTVPSTTFSFGSQSSSVIAATTVPSTTFSFGSQSSLKMVAIPAPSASSLFSFGLPNNSVLTATTTAATSPSLFMFGSIGDSAASIKHPQIIQTSQAENGVDPPSSLHLQPLLHSTINNRSPRSLLAGSMATNGVSPPLRSILSSHPGTGLSAYKPVSEQPQSSDLLVNGQSGSCHTAGPQRVIRKAVRRLRS